MRLNSEWLTVATLAVGIAGLVAPDVANASHTICNVDNPLRTITTVGKGQSPSNNPKVTHAITGNIIDLPTLGPTAHRISLCTGTFVSIAITDSTGGPTIDPLPPLSGLTCSSLGPGAASCTGVVSAKETYVARSADGKDTDRMTLLPVGEPPFSGLIGSHQCVLDATSGLDIFTQLFAGPLSFPLVGSADVSCGLVDPVTGKTVCTCDIQEIAPIPIPNIGLVCVSPAPGCDPGEIDCDGGNPLDVEVRSDHNIGSCAGNCSVTTDQVCLVNQQCPPGNCSIRRGQECRRNSDCPDTETCENVETCVNGQLGCEANCQSYCTGLGLDFVTSGCEGFCTEPPHRACEFDSFCGAFFEGSCAGGDAFAPGTGVPHGGTCGCNCGLIDGSPSRAGGLLCNVGADIKIVAPTATCDANPIITVGQACIPVTTETVTNLLSHANNGANELPCFNANTASCVPGTGGLARTGAPTDCPLLAESITTGASLEGAVNFFDSAIGDLAVSIEFTCQ